MTLVVDANVVSCWFLDEPEAAAANRLLRTEEKLIAPDLLFVECGNVFAYKAMVGAISESDAAVFLREIRRFVPDTVPSTEIVAGAMMLAIRNHHPIYDCLYLQLAIQSGSRVVTLDRRFLQKFAASPHARHIIHLDDWNPAP